VGAWTRYVYLPRTCPTASWQIIGQ